MSIMSENIAHFIDDLHSQNYIDEHTYSSLKPPTPLHPKTDFRFLQFQLELLTSNIINCQHFDYSAGIQGYLSAIIREASY